MAELLTKKTGGISPVDALVIAGGKVAIDAGLAFVRVPSGTFLSAGIKAAGAFLLSGMIGGKAGGLIGASAMVSAGDDLVMRLLGGRKASGVVQIGSANQGAGVQSAI